MVQNWRPSPADGRETGHVIECKLDAVPATTDFVAFRADLFKQHPCRTIVIRNLDIEGVLEGRSPERVVEPATVGQDRRVDGRIVWTSEVVTKQWTCYRAGRGLRGGHGDIKLSQAGRGVVRERKYNKP